MRDIIKLVNDILEIVWVALSAIGELLMLVITAVSLTLEFIVGLVLLCFMTPMVGIAVVIFLLVIAIL